jgi:hypothetical protein
MFGDHVARSMANCEGQAACSTHNEENKTLLSTDLDLFKRMSRAGLVAMLWENIGKEITALNNSRYRLRIEVLPASYKWEGAYGSFLKIIKGNRTRDNIKVIVMLTLIQYKVWHRRGKIYSRFNWTPKEQSMRILLRVKMWLRSNH